jgi:hypothetical protein
MGTRGAGRKVQAKPLPAPLDRIQLSVGGDAPLAGYGGEEDPGVMDWWGKATVTVYPQEDDEPGGAGGIRRARPWGRRLPGTASS